MNKNTFTLTDFYYYTINLDDDLKLIRVAVRNKERTKLKFLDNGEIVDISLIDNFFGVYQKAKINEREYMIDSLFDLLYQKHNEDKILNDLKVSLRVVFIDAFKNSLKLTSVRNFEKNWNKRMRDIYVNKKEVEIKEEEFINF